MVLFGLLLLGAVAAFTGLLIADNLDGGPEYTVTVLGNELATMNSLSIFLAGMALALLFGFALLLLRGGGMRSRRRARERAALTAAAAHADAVPPTPRTGEPVADPTATRRKHRLHFGH
ncbi:hypothetical protein ACIA8O_36270 [Kitasatospora sp. NPDC051853]|uniref:hypothetical protein n=1 Tax=Kitasatospora sp. NPDC051853 TaxID=3364058 RepID=UPI0037B96E4E